MISADPHPVTSPQSALSRADLMAFYATFGAEGLQELAPLLGFRRRVKAKNEGPSISSKKDAPSSKLSAAPEKILQDDYNFDPWCLKEWVPREQEQEGEPAWYVALQPLAEEEMAADKSKSMPPQPPLLPWSALWPFLRGALGALRHTGEVRLGPLIEGVTTGRWPSHIPRKTRLAWASTCHVIVDTRLEMRPFLEDFEGLLEPLKQMRGEGGLTVWAADGGPYQKWRLWGAETRKMFPKPPPGTPVLVVGDLGHYQKQTQPWLQFGRQLRRWGCLPMALLPCPKYLWNADMTRTWTMALWDVGMRLPQFTPGRRPIGRPTAAGENEVVAKFINLASFLAPAIRVEPGLLRTARRLLPHGMTDVGSEYAFWNHADGMRNTFAAALHPEDRKELQAQFAQRSQTRCLQLLDALAAFHAPHSPAIAHEEHLVGLRLLGKPYPQGETYFLRMSKSAATAGPSFKVYGDRLANRQTEQDWQEGEGRALTWVMLNRDALDAGTKVPPAGLDAYRFPWAFGENLLEREWLLSMAGEKLRFQVLKEAEPVDGLEMGVPLGILSEKGGLLEMVGELASYGHRLEAETVFDLVQGTSWEIRTLTGSWILEELPMSSWQEWAGGMGCDARGLFADIKPELGQGRLRWLAPGWLRVVDGAGMEVGSWALKQGCWMAEDQAALFAGGVFQQPDWAKAVGVDGFGIHADVWVKDVRQRFRWLFPGTFLMGSPEGEPGRPTREEGKPWTDETQHPVTLTHGFWLAETTVTQALWQAVMDTNPSEIKGKELPVDSVSWNDCQEFIDKLAATHGLMLCLPTEGQWEYACRAGTTTAYHFGDTITTDQVNFNGNHPNQGSPVGNFRETTLAAQALPANAWGIYQMHGNVFEWCADWLGNYTGNYQVNLKGPDLGRDRVLRGGSWYNNGRCCRSGFRYGHLADYGDDLIGFRLVRS